MRKALISFFPFSPSSTSHRGSEIVSFSIAPAAVISIAGALIGDGHQNTATAASGHSNGVATEELSRHPTFATVATLAVAHVLVVHALAGW